MGVGVGVGVCAPWSDGVTDEAGPIKPRRLLSCRFTSSRVKDIHQEGKRDSALPRYKALRIVLQQNSVNDNDKGHIPDIVRNRDSTANIYT